MLTDILTVTWRWTQVILGFGLLIFVHELGHFLLAKRVGVRVLKFSLGFGPVLFGFRRREDDTEYVVSAIPLGGYVKMAGENPGEDREGKPDEFPSRSVGERARVLVAGPAMNLLLAVPLSIVMYMIGIDRPAPRINEVVPGAPAWEAGLKRGDVVREFDGEEVETWIDLRVKLELCEPRTRHTLTVERDGQLLDFSMVSAEDKSVGIHGKYWGGTIGSVVKGSAAAEAGLRPGDVIQTVNGRRIGKWGELIEATLDSAGQQLSIAVKRPLAEGDGAPRSVTISATPKKMRFWHLGLQVNHPAVVGHVRGESVAAQAGLRKGDQVLKVNGAPISYWTEIVDAVTSSDSPVSLEVLRKDETVPLIVTLTPEDGTDAASRLGLGHGPRLVITGFSEQCRAQEAGIETGDEILEVGKEAVAAAVTAPRSPRLLLYDLVAQAQSEQERAEPIRLVVKRAGKEITKDVDLVEGRRGFLGLSPAYVTVKKKFGFLGATRAGIEKTVDVAKLTCIILVKLVQRKVSAKNITGPVGIAAVSYHQARQGLSHFLDLIVLISVNLAIINLLPVPILDGGHLAFLAVERVKGSPVSERTLAVAQYVGLILLVALMLYVLTNDVTRLIAH